MLILFPYRAISPLPGQFFRFSGNERSHYDLLVSKRQLRENRTEDNAARSGGRRQDRLAAQESSLRTIEEPHDSHQQKQSEKEEQRSTMAVQVPV